MGRKYKLSNADYKLINLIWENEPIKSPKLCSVANEKLGWKKSTTYTVLRRLCEKEVAKNEKAKVSSLIGKKQIQIEESGKIVERKFDNSLPKFIAAFLEKEKLTENEAKEIAEMIEKYKGENDE